jgi:hypothetical protein
MAPKFSIDARRLTITFALAIRLAARARLILTIASGSCGIRQAETTKEVKSLAIADGNGQTKAVTGG